jgi:alkanesulfonate monooxygenase SsuD/methylene tetrahydromethanopterin reductase-like flavin-dependent oxidoreductase (luciferase family)
VEFFAFHLMPYRHLDFAEADKHRAYWVVLPNRLYDPVAGADLYQEYIDQLVYAAELGFDGVCVNEHHQTAYGLMPAPNLIASILIDRTRGTNVRIPVIGRALPLVSNPVAVAEEFAMLDNLSKGRLIAGFVRGIGNEYHSSGLNPTSSQQRFLEAHDIIVRAWREDGPFSFEGEHHNLRYVNPWPRCYQQPHPPIWIPSQGSAETIEWAAAPERRYPFIITFQPAASILRNHTAYREAARRYGYEASGDQLGWAAPIYVAESDEVAERESGEHIERLFNDYLYSPLEMLIPPGYTSIRSLKAILTNRGGTVFEPQTLRQLVDKSTFVVGSPTTVRDKIAEMQSRTGFKKMVCMIQFGTLPDPLVRKSMQLFAEDVMPGLRGL